MGKTHVLLTFGGYPDEHETTIISASNILPCIAPEKYVVNLLYITKNGEWLLCDTSQFKVNCDVVDEIVSTIQGKPVYLKIGDIHGAQLVDNTSHQSIPVDVVFSLLTNKHGNDGGIQGLWSVANIPYTGPGILSAAVALDKDVAKRLLEQAGLPICKYKTFSRDTLSQTSLNEIEQLFGVPFVMKPASSGSSLGVHKIDQDSDFSGAIEDIFFRDKKLIIEEYIEGSELEVYCLGVGKEVKTTIIRESIVKEGLYTYEAKYIDDSHVIKNVPAKIPDEVALEVQELAIKTYQILEGCGLARVDFFYSNDGHLFVNEINTSPAFMSHAHQPPLWEISGISYQELVELMITAAFQNFHKTDDELYM